MERTGFRPLYSVPILYLASLYACPALAGALSQGAEPAAADSSAASVLLVPICLAFANIAAALVGYQFESRAFLLNSSVLLKYGLVPFFVAGGALVALLALSGLIPVPFMIFVGPPAALTLSVVGWVLMAASSSYSIAYLIAARRDGMHSTASTVINALLQFFFVADVMVLAWREGRWRGLTVVVAIGVGILALALLIGAGWLVSSFVSGVASASA